VTHFFERAQEGGGEVWRDRELVFGEVEVAVEPSRIAALH